MSTMQNLFLGRVLSNISPGGSSKVLSVVGMCLLTLIRILQADFGRQDLRCVMVTHMLKMVLSPSSLWQEWTFYSSVRGSMRGTWQRTRSMVLFTFSLVSGRSWVWSFLFPQCGRNGPFILLYAGQCGVLGRELGRWSCLLFLLFQEGPGYGSCRAR